MFHCELKTLNVWFLAENVCPYDRVIGSCCGSAIDHYYKLLEARNQIENNTSFRDDLELLTYTKNHNYTTRYTTDNSNL